MIRMIELRVMRWTRHRSGTGNQIHAYNFSENLKRRDRLEDLGTDGRIILKRS
jgi:hypothetical protein